MAVVSTIVVDAKVLYWSDDVNSETEATSIWLWAVFNAIDYFFPFLF